MRSLSSDDFNVFGSERNEPTYLILIVFNYDVGFYFLCPRIIFLTDVLFRFSSLAPFLKGFIRISLVYWRGHFFGVCCRFHGNREKRDNFLFIVIRLKIIIKA